ncbi:MAG: hypothetical protein ABIS68_04290 [Casimicrobiaceae bacterium]
MTGFKARHSLCVAGCLLVSSCANLSGIAPGTPAASVESSAGKPSRVWPEPGGGASWEYPLGPQGRYTYMVRMGSDVRVTRVDQVLDWDTFSHITKGMPMSEVEHLLGRPFSKVAFPLTGQTAWSWRFIETVWPRCFYAYEDANGKVEGTGARDEIPGTLGAGLEIPC